MKKAVLSLLFKVRVRLLRRVHSHAFLQRSPLYYIVVVILALPKDYVL